MNAGKISKLQATFREWKRIVDKEMAYSEDLRNIERLTKAEDMCKKIQDMIFFEMFDA